MGRPPALAPHGGTPAPLPVPRSPAPPPPRALTGLAQARLGHGGGRGAPPRPVPRRPRQRCRRSAPRRAAGKGRGSGGRRGTAGSRGGPGRRSGPSRRGGGGSAVGAAAAAEGAAVGRAAGAVRGAGARAALLCPLPALLDVRRHPRPRRAAARRAQRLLRLQPRLRRYRRDADGRAAGAGAALPARRGQVAPGAAGTALCWAGTAAAPGRTRCRRPEEGPGLGGRKGGLFLCKKPPQPHCWPRAPRRSRIKP